MGIFSSFKDNLSSFTGEQAVRKIVEPYGDLKEFKINSSAKTIHLTLMLIGEKEPVDIRINRYELQTDRSKTYITFHDVKTSREWLNRVAKDYLSKQRFEIPEKYSSIITKFL